MQGIEQLRQLPGYFAATLVAAIGAIWLFAAVFGRGSTPAPSAKK